MPDVNLNPGGSVQDPNAGGQPNANANAGANTGAQGDQPANTGQVPIHALHEEREKRQALQAETQTLKEQMQEMKSAMAHMQQGNNQSIQPTGINVGGQIYPQQQSNRNLEELWESNPRQAMQTEIMMAVNWYDKVSTQLDSQEESLASKYPDFNSYRPEVRKYLRTLPAAERAKNGVVELAYFLVRGQNSEKIWDKRQTDLLDKIRRGEEVQGLRVGTTSVSAQPKATKVTSEQHNVAVAMGMSDEEYLKNVR